MLTELIQAATIIDSVVSERMKVYEASFKFEVKNAPESVSYTHLTLPTN